MTDALKELLEILGAEEKLEQFSERFADSGMDREAREYEEIYGLVIELFEKFKGLLGDECVSRREYAEPVHGLRLLCHEPGPQIPEHALIVKALLQNIQGALDQPDQRISRHIPVFI